MRLLVVLLSFIVIQTVSAQIGTVCVIDSLTHEPISFCKIQLSDSIVLVDNNGFFKSHSLINKTCEVSALGYRNKTIKLTNNLTKIYLAPIDYKLNEVIIESNRFRHKKVIGPIKKINLIPSFLKISQNRGSLLVLIPNESILDSYIKSIKFPINFLSDNLLIQIRIKENNENKPGDDLLKEQVIIKSDTIRKNINLLKYGIKFPKEGVFIGFDWSSSNANAPLWNRDEFTFIVKYSEKSTNIVFAKFGTADKLYNLYEFDKSVRIVPKIGIEIVY